MVRCGVVLAIRLGFAAWFWVGFTFWLYLVWDNVDDKSTDVLQDVPYQAGISLSLLVGK